MEAYALFDAPRTYTFDAFADLSPVLEPPLLAYSGKPIPTAVNSEVEGWRRVEGTIDDARFSTTPPRFHRDITSQVARPVGQYAALRLEDQPAPYFEVTGLNGNKMTLADFEGQAMLIDFWATWCPPCLESMPKLDELDRRYGNKGLAVLGMNMDEGSNAARTARQFVSDHGFGFRQSLAGSAAADFNVEVLPTLFLLDRDHTIRAVYIGLPPDSDTLAREVEMALR
jgi:thiol-disulfide isomerase/thioredoxin